MHPKVHCGIYICMNNILKCTNIEVDDCVHKNIFRFTNKRVPRFLIFDTMHISGLDPIRLSPPCETKIILLAMV